MEEGNAPHTSDSIQPLNSDPVTFCDEVVPFSMLGSTASQERASYIWLG